MPYTDITVGPGFAGFVVLFLLAVAMYVLFRSLTHHVRKTRHAAQERRKEANAPDTQS